MNWAQLLKALRKFGYEGDGSVKGVKAWLASRGYPDTEIEINGKSYNIDETAKVTAKAAITMDDDAAEDDDAEPETKGKANTDDEDDDTDADDDSITVSKKELETLKKSVAAGKKAARGKGALNLGDDDDTGRSVANHISAHNRRLEHKSYENRIKSGGWSQEWTPSSTHLQGAPFGSAEECELYGAYTRMAGAELSGKTNYPEYQRDREICGKANLETVFSTGGFTTPELFNASLIRIRANYGAVPQIMATFPMQGMVEIVPRDLTSGVTVYAPGEGVAATEGNPTGDNVKLQAFEMVALCTASKRLLAHSAINFGDFIANAIQYKVAQKIDEIYFSGDATSTYFNQMGLLGKYNKLVLDAGGTWTLGTNSTNAEYAAGCVRAASSTWASITSANVRAVIALTMDAENAQNQVILCSKQFDHQVLRNVATWGAGGVTATEVVNGVKIKTFDGNPVIWCNAMPRVGGSNDAIVMHFGDFNLGTKFGEVAGSQQMDTSDQAYWTTRKIGYQYSTCVAFNCHDLGNASSTAGSRTPGPTAFLITTST